MTKMSNTRKVKKGKVEAPIKRRNLTSTELQEFIGLTTLVNGEMWKAMQVGGNTALVTNGIEVAKQLEDTVKVLLNAKNNWVSQMLAKCGVAQGVRCSIDSNTGIIVENVEEPKKEVKIDDKGKAKVDKSPKK